MVSPKLVVTTSSKVTATEVAIGQLVLVDELEVEVEVWVPVGVGTPPLGVCDAGNEVAVADEYEPATVLVPHWLGTAATPPAQEGGITPARRSAAERNAAYDQVKSVAERGWPSFLSNCSARWPSVPTYFATIATYPS